MQHKHVRLCSARCNGLSRGYSMMGVCCVTMNLTLCHCRRHRAYSYSQSSMLVKPVAHRRQALLCTWVPCCTGRRFSMLLSYVRGHGAGYPCTSSWLYCSLRLIAHLTFNGCTAAYAADGQEVSGRGVCYYNDDDPSLTHGHVLPHATRHGCCSDGSCIVFFITVFCSHKGDDDIMRALQGAARLTKGCRHRVKCMTCVTLVCFVEPACTLPWRLHAVSSCAYATVPAVARMFHHATQHPWCSALCKALSLWCSMTGWCWGSPTSLPLLAFARTQCIVAILWGVCQALGAHRHTLP